MNWEILYGLLKRLDSYVDLKPGRKILLLIDHCAPHGRVESMPTLQNVSVWFLTSNTTSRMQPLDAEINALVKRHYKRRPLLRGFEKLEAQAKSTYNVDALIAIR